jgi:hypothetical protein
MVVDREPILTNKGIVTYKTVYKDVLCLRAIIELYARDIGLV